MQFVLLVKHSKHELSHGLQILFPEDISEKVVEGQFEMQELFDKFNDKIHLVQVVLVVEHSKHVESHGLQTFDPEDVI